MGRIVSAIGWLADALSGEFILTRMRRANGGTVVLLRALLISALLYVGGIALMNWVDPRRGGLFDGIEARIQLVDHAKWWGALFGSAYAALYARFASQWAYVAGVYNQLKATQARKDHDEVALAEWRAGFIEDCDDLHLVRKPMFASIVHGLLSDATPNSAQIREVFDEHTPGGAARRERIANEVAAVVGAIERTYGVVDGCRDMRESQADPSARTKSH